MLRVCSAFILLALLSFSPSAAMTLGGAARAVDGDTLDLQGERIRLIGIDAPEISQDCERGGKRWPCGDWARGELHARITGHKVSCKGQERDRYGRLLATCRIGDADLGQSLVRDGVAFAYRRYSTAYVSDEKRAERAGIGLWAGSAERPEDYRHVAEGAEAPRECTIKGNISGHGRIYHQPGQHDYDATRINPAKGERWFCSAGEGEAAGWRAARW